MAPLLAARSAAPTVELRARWRAPQGRSSLDVRAQHGPLTATPQMLASGITRSDVRAVGELTLARPLRLRGMGRAATLRDDAGGTNQRIGFGAGVVLGLTPLFDVTLQGQQVRYTRPGTGSYFAPRLAQLVEAASYVEVEAGSRAVFAFDVGVGVQRVAEFGSPVGDWSRALRLYSLTSFRLAPGRELRLEVEGEDSPLGNEAATGPGWHYLAASLSLRWGL